MATNEILPFCEDDTGTNLLTQAEYLADAERLEGNTAGSIARSTLVNKFSRQASIISAGVAQFMADNQDENITDSLTPEQISSYLSKAITNEVDESSVVKYSQVSFLSDSTQSLAGNVSTKIAFNSVVKDDGGLWSAGSYRFIVIDEGKYEFTSLVSIFLNNAISSYATISLDLYKNGEFFKHIDGGAGLGQDFYILGGASGIVAAVSGDYFELFFTNGTGSTATARTSPANNGDKNLFEIRYIGQ